MTEFKDTQQQISKFRLRVAAAGLFVLVCFGLIGLRFFWLQVWNHSKYSLQADENRISVAPIVPNRGIITDRNGVVLAKNYSAYTLEITPSKLTEPLDETIDDLSQIVSITPLDRRRFKKLLEDSKNFESLPIRTRLTDEEVAHFTAQRFRFPGVDVRARLFRQYPLGPVAAHVIGYIGRISPRDRDHIEQMSEENDSDPEHYDPRLDANNYKGTDYIGKIGVEQSYETELHGLTGFEEVEVTAGGRPVRTLSRTQATPGNNLRLSIDIGLQEVAEQAFAGKQGALVAIQPSTGDVLAFVSAPSFDPNLFVDGIDQQTWDSLNNSPEHPLLNRPLHGTYPPGSTYKPFMALAALTLHKRTPQWGFQDPGYYMFGGHRFNNDVRSGQGWIDMNRAIMVSNDTYFFMLAHDLGVDAIAKFMKPLGFGQLTGIDISGEARGILPSTEWKRHAYKNPAQQKWYEGETVSLGIGQGYNSFTILQLAHAYATLADNGIIMKPHLVKDIENPITHQVRLTVPKESGRLDVSQADIDVVKRGMEGVTMNPAGTAYQIFGNAPYTSAGKTGTAQVYSLQGAKYQAHAIAENLRDHALFAAFAPADNPQIAVALIVEHGGWGAQAAGPIARRVIDYYLLDRKKPGALQAEVAAAASEAQEASAPTVDTPDIDTTDAPVGPVKVAAGFTPLPIPGAASDAAASGAAVAGAASGASAASAAAAPASASAAASAAAPAAASQPAVIHVPRRSGAPRPRRPASAPDGVALAPSRNDGEPPQAATGGTGRDASDGSQR